MIRPRFSPSLSSLVVCLALTLACGGGGGGSSPAVPASVPAPYVRSAALSGGNEVPANASPAVATGQVSVNPTTLALTGSVVSTGLQGTAAHIHEGAVGVAGPVVITLTGGTGGIWTVPAGTVLTSAQYASLQAGSYYFNVHSSTFPAGEIRGQLRAQTPQDQAVRA